MATLPAPALEHVADLTVFVAAPIPITGGTLRGPQLNGRVLAGGADFQLVVSDTAADLDARYIIALDGPEFAGEHVRITQQ